MSEPQGHPQLLLPVLIVVTAVGPLALNIFIPSMPGMQTVFATDYATIQLTLTAYLIATALAQLVLGPLSDRFGRRPVLLSGLMLFVGGGLLCALAAGIGQLIFGRVVQAVGGSAGFVLGRAVVRDLYDQETAASKIAYVTMAMVVAPMLAPVLGGFLDVWLGWQAGFWLVTGAGVAVALLVWRRLPETNRRRSSGFNFTGMLADYRLLLGSAQFCGYALTLSFSSAVFFAFLAGAPYLMVEMLGRSPGDYGLYFMLVSLGYMGGNFLAGRLSRRLGTLLMIVIGCSLASAGGLTLIGLAAAGVLTPLALFGPMSLTAVGNGMALPNATAAAISVRPTVTGAASGLAGCLQIAFGALATWVVGQLQGDSQWPMVLVMSTGTLLAWAALGVARRGAIMAAE